MLRTGVPTDRLQSVCAGALLRVLVPVLLRAPGLFTDGQIPALPQNEAIKVVAELQDLSIVVTKSVDVHCYVYVSELARTATDPSRDYWLIIFVLQRMWRELVLNLQCVFS